MAAIACGLGDDAAASRFNGDVDQDASTGPTGNNPFTDAGGATVLQQDAVLLVHAANAPAFRLCFESAPDIQPMPNTTLKPA